MMIVKGELGRLRKKTVMASLKALSLQWYRNLGDLLSIKQES